jgi:sulfite oxidase
MNCHWRGPRLRDVLLRARPSLEGKGHVAFACYSTDVQEDTWYGGSIELERGMSEDGEVILALEVGLKNV